MPLVSVRLGSTIIALATVDGDIGRRSGAELLEEVASPL
jgi:hypothetical protein